MDLEALKARNELIKIRGKETRAKRKTQVCRVFKVKIDENNLTLRQKEELKMMFIEAKWLWNDIINYSQIEGNKPWDFKVGKTVQVRNKDEEFETKKFKYLPFQIRQTIKEQICSNIKTLSTLKKKKKQIPGRIKFKSELNSVHIKLIPKNFIRDQHHIKIPGVHRNVRVNGLKQFIDIPNIEYACAKVLKTPKGYYVLICTYTLKDQIKEKEKLDKLIGIDFGCSTAFTTSEGEKINVYIKESDRLKRLQRQLDRQIYQKNEHNKFILKDILCKDGKVRQVKVLLKVRSNNAKRTQRLINIEYQKISNRKIDLSNKIVAKFKQFKTVVIQDEQLSNWKKSGHGRAVQYSVLGRVKAKLKTLPNIVVLDKFIPTTKLCTNCGQIKNDLKLWNRVFKCDCGVEQDRDVHAAENMLWFFKNNVGVGHTKLKRVEIEEMVKRILSSSLTLPMKHEDLVDNI